MSIITLTFIIILIYIALQLFKYLKSKASLGETLFVIFYIFSIIIFLFGFAMHANPYYTAVDPIDGGCYIPFGEQHIISLFVYYILFMVSVVLIWTRQAKLSPIIQVFALVFLFIGVIISSAIVFQILGHDTSTISPYIGNDNLPLLFMPIFNVVIGIILLIQAFENKQASNIKYKSTFLNKCNKILGTTLNLHIWAIIFLIPVLLVITVILILFGQDSNSLIKVFTETTTWTFSQKQHPPILDHKGHYLCTVAAKGHPKIVKPLFIGKRYNQPIIVNRQLQIANAFEEFIFEEFPKFHYIIRKFYDQYGYNLSRKINNKIASNVTYILMKPLEYIFLIILYTCTYSPEEKIKKQYNAS